MKNNKGLSLVELIVTIALVSIVGGGILGFLITGTKHYRMDSSEINLQYEAQLTMNQLQDMVLNATNGVNYATGSSDASACTLTIYERDSATAYYAYTVVWNKTESRLYYNSYLCTLTGSSYSMAPEVKNEVLADYVTDFSVDLSKLATNNLITFKIAMNYDKRSYSTDKQVKPRNKIEVEANPYDAFKNAEVAWNEKGNIRDCSLGEEKAIQEKHVFSQDINVSRRYA